MTIEIAVELFLFLKNAHDNYNGNKRDCHLLVRRLSDLEEPLLKCQSRQLIISIEALETLEEVLKKSQTVSR